MILAAKNLVTNIILGGKMSPSLKSAFSQAQKSASDTSLSMKNVGKIAGTAMLAAGVAVTAGLGISIKSAMDYQTSLAKVGTIADVQKVSLENLSKGVIDLSNNTGVAAGEINASLYEALSAGADTAKATGLVAVAIKAAKGGFTDTATAIDGLTSVMNTYGIATGDAEGLANQFIITQNLGKTTIGELAGSIGKLAPIMKAADLPTQNMMSALAATTAQGIQTSESVSGLKAAISNIIKPTDEAMKVAKSLGLEFNTSALASKGLAGFLMDVKDKTGGNLDTMAQLFGSVEGLNTVLALTSDGGMNVFNQSMDQMKNNTTALEDAYKKMSNTTAERMTRMANKAKNAGILIGDALLTSVEKVFTAIENLHLEKMFDSPEFKAGMQQVTAFLEKMIKFGGDLMTKLMPAFQSIYNNAIKPLIPVFNQLVDAIMPVVLAIADALKPVLDAILPPLVNIIKSIMPSVLKMFGALGPMIQALTPVISFLAQVVGIALGNAFKIIGPVINNIINALTGFMTFITGVFTGNWNMAWEGFKTTFKNVWGGLFNILKMPLNGLIAGVNTLIGAINLIKIPGFPSINIPKIPMLAAGATLSSPTLAMIAEEGTESVVPHNNKPRSRALLAEAAAGVGVKLGGGNTYVYSPVINGGGNNVGSQLKDGYDDFVAYIERYSRNKERESYA